MRIGVFLGAFSPDVGGGHTMQADLFEALCETSHETKHSFSVFYNKIHHKDPSGSSNVDGNIEMIPIAPSSAPRRVVSTLKRNSFLARKIFRGRSALENLARPRHIELMWFVGGGANESLDIPYVATVWDLQHRLQPWFPEVSAEGVWESREVMHRSFLQRATYVATGTREGKRQIETLYQIQPQCIKILPLPTPSFALKSTASLEKSALEKYDLSPGYLLYPAQFWAHKNHANLVLAIKHLRDFYNLTVPMVFVGSDKGNMQYVKSLIIENSLMSQVRILGFVQQNELLSLYRHARAIPFVTYFGPDNLPPLEAFALGCPVIASDIPGAKEQLGNAALYVDPSNPADIASAITRLIQDENIRNSLIEKGRERAACWTARDYVKSMYSVFDEFESVRRCWPAGN